MKFKQQQPIYLQIADYICERILSAEWSIDAKIPSIRDMAIDVAVNPNTAARSYDYLEGLGIIYMQRGVGYFVAQDAVAKITNLKKTRFFQEDLPQLFKTMQHLSVGLDEIQNLHQAFNANAVTNSSASVDKHSTE